MDIRFAKAVIVLVALGLVAASVVTTASAHVGASHSPFTTNGPDLRSVVIDGDDAADYCFDEEVSGDLDAGDFTLRGYDSATEVAADDADLDSEDENCVEAGFDTDRPIEQFTMGIVAEGAVETRDGEDNIEASASLGESEVDEEGTEGKTDAPNLKFNFDIDSIKYFVDDHINCPTMSDASAFGYYTEEGEGSEQLGSVVEDCDEGEITIDFPNDVDDVARVFIDPDSGKEPCTHPPSGKCVGFESEGDETDDPDLEDAERDDDEVTFMFDEDVAGDPDEAQFQVVAEDGTKFLAAAGTCDIDDGTDVTCRYPAIEDAAEHDVVVAGVGDCAVEADADSECNTVGDVPITDSVRAPGLSDAPDLESCDINEASNMATFFFDEEIDEDSATSSDGFDLFDVDGNMSGASDVDDSDETSISMEFDEDAVEDAVGCHVDFDAVDDFLGNASPEASVGAVQPTTAGGTTTNGPPSTTVSDTTTSPPVPIDVRSTVSIAYDRPVFKGKVRSGRAGCERRRRVVLKKRKRGADPQVGNDVTNASGDWSVRQRNASGRYYAVALRKVFTLANGDTIRCVPAVSETRRVG